AGRAGEEGGGETILLDLVREGAERRRVLELLFDDPEPADPARLVAPRPERGVARPEPVGPALRVPVLQLQRDLGGQRRGHGVRLRVDPGLVGLAAPPLDGLQQLPERLRELLDAVREQLLADLAERNTLLLQ